MHNTRIHPFLNFLTYRLTYFVTNFSHRNQRYLCIWIDAQRIRNYSRCFHEKQNSHAFHARIHRAIPTIFFPQVSREGKKRAESKFHGGSSVQRGKSVALSARYIRSSPFRRGQLEPPRENVANKATRYTGTSFLKHSMLHPRQGVQQPSNQTMEGANR